MNNNIIFKGIKDGILIILNETVSFDEIKTSLIDKLNENKQFFDGANSNISFKGRSLSENEEIDLLKIISTHSNLKISFVKTIEENNEAAPLKKEQILKTQNNLNQTLGQNTKNNQTITAENNSTYYYKGSLRSGQSIDFNGSVVIIGDVNPGAEVRAVGNIIILGKLKGLAHAGCSGIKNCFVSAILMTPTQLIIGDTITYFPKNTDKNLVPEYAYEKNGQIFVEPLLNFVSI